MDGKNKKNTSSNDLPSSVKGTIAVMVTTLIVVIITMLFARSLFISNASDTERKTGWLTSTQPLETTASTTTTTTQAQSQTQAEGDDESEADSDESGDESALDGNVTIMTVVSAVYLHPEPTSASENLLVIPQGATVRVYRNENGWLYLDYDGQQGYAYYTFFE